MGYVHIRSGDFVSYRETKERFDDWVDELVGPVDILGMEYNSSYVLKTIDSIAYREMYLNWINAEYPDSEWDEEDD